MKNMTAWDPFKSGYPFRDSLLRWLVLAVISLVLPLGKVTAQQPAHGAGYCQAKPNDWCFVYADFSVRWPGGIGGGLHVQRIEWGDSGKTIKVIGIDPKTDSLTPLTITSDRLVDGMLILTFKETGDKRYGFNILFGKIASVEETTK